MYCLCVIAKIYFFTLGPVFGYLLDKTNFRVCALLGGIIMTVGTVGSAFTETDIQLLITFGIITGSFQGFGSDL